MFTKNMEYTVNVHDQKQYIVQFIMFTNRTARIYLKCSQIAVQRNIHVHSTFSAGQRQNYPIFQNTDATFLCLRNAFILAFFSNVHSTIQRKELACIIEA